MGFLFRSKEDNTKNKMNTQISKLQHGPDKNFDDLAHKFKKKVYGNLKGRIRLEVLKRDLAEFFPDMLDKSSSSRLRILDAGSGHGPFSLFLARLGHDVTLCDISANMLELAQQDINRHKLHSRTTLIHGPIQTLEKNQTTPYDMVLCHAVLEWVDDPQDLITHLLDHLKPDGILSVTFYNLNGMIFKNLLRTNYKKILNQKYTGWAGSLTPTHPLKPETVLNWFEKHRLTLLCHSGMRVFHDYILNMEDKDRCPDVVVKLELEFSRQMPYRDLGRYQHILLQKSNSNMVMEKENRNEDTLL